MKGAFSLSTFDFDGAEIIKNMVVDEFGNCFDHAIKWVKQYLEVKETEAIDELMQTIRSVQQRVNAENEEESREAALSAIVGGFQYYSFPAQTESEMTSRYIVIHFWGYNLWLVYINGKFNYCVIDPNENFEESLKCFSLLDAEGLEEQERDYYGTWTIFD